MQHGNNLNNTDVHFKHLKHQRNHRFFTGKFTRFSALLGIAFALLSPGLQSSSRGDTPFLTHTDDASTTIAAHRLPDNYKLP